MLQLTEMCDSAFNAVIYEEIEQHKGFDFGQPQTGKEQFLESVQSSEAMPDWAKTMAQQAFAELDWPKLQAEMSAARIGQLRRFLGRG